MSFANPLFLLIFFPAVLLLYWALGPRTSWQNMVLVVSGYLYFASWGPKALPVFVAAAFVNYAIMVGLRKRDDDGLPVRAVVLLPLGVIYNLGQLLLLKYLGFFEDTFSGLAHLMGVQADLPVVRLILPIGISFWTLQIVGILIDVAYGRREAPKSLLDFAAFVAFFPQILSGPIARADLLEQMQVPRRFSAHAFARGGFLFLLGYSMKFLVSATLGDWTQGVFSTPSQFDSSSHWLALFAYTMQIFCDFAGYSLIAQGLACFFGLSLVDNFRFPFLARNISDFWKRWHISLTNFLFDYVYTPLVTGSGLLRGRLAAGLFVVLLTSGLWHGATWMFVLWGALHGAVLAIAHRWDEFYRGLCRKDKIWVKRRKSVVYAFGAWFITQFWFMLSLVPFRMPSLDGVAQFASGLFGGGGVQHLVLGDSVSSKANMLLCLAFVGIYHLSATDRGGRVVAWFMRWPAPLRGFVYGLAIIYLFIFKPLSEGAFIYAQF